MARKLTLEPRHESDTWVLGDRWRWEETGQVFVFGAENVPHDEVKAVARCVQRFVEELALPISVQADEKSNRREQMIQLINSTKEDTHIDNQLLLTKLNQRRWDSEQLRPGLVILLNPNDFDAFHRSGETQPGIYGTTHDDGICLLRVHHEEAVRHEFAHMLGLGEHCQNADCVMRWECPTPHFCEQCTAKLKSICRVKDE